jgi:iron complex transport system substrate-binding protein
MILYSIYPRWAKPVCLSLITLGCLVLAISCNTNAAENQLATGASTIQSTISDNSALASLSIAPKTNFIASCIPEGEFNSETDYFPNKASVNYADGFSIQYHNSFKILVIDATDTTESQTFVLAQCGAPIPNTNFPVITIPIESAFLSSTTQYPSFIELRSVTKITGIGQVGFISSEEIIEHVKTNDVVEFAANFEVGTEAVIESNPNVLMSNGFPDPAYSKLAELNIPVINWMDWQETSALGRAEWMLITSSLLNQELTGTLFINKVISNYEEVVQKATRARSDKVALAGSAFQGTFYAPGGASYIANLLKDANIGYVWSQTTDTGSLYLDLESVIADGVTADIWINAPAQWATIEQGLSEDSRYGELDCVQESNVWTHTLLVNKQGADDYFERAASRPDLLLADLVKIAHPNLMIEHNFEWYQQIPNK